MNIGTFLKAQAGPVSKLMPAFGRLVVALFLLIWFPATLLAQNTGDFLVANYSTGEIQNNNYLWRGYVFRPSRDVVVEGLYGGSGTSCQGGGFNGAIFEVALNETKTQYTVGSILRTVEFEANANLTQEYIDFSSPLTLRGDSYYLMAQGRISSGTGCHYATTALDFNNLQIGSAIIGEWFPASDAALQPSGDGNGSHLVGVTRGLIAPNNTTPVRVLMGFRYRTDVLPADLADVETTAFQLSSTNNVVVSGILGDSGQTNSDQSLTLYFEWATSSSFSNSTLQPADPFTVVGSATDLPFGATLSLNAGTTYHVRAVAINEAGRTNAKPIIFTTGAMAEGFSVTASVPDGGGTVTPAARAVQDGQTTTFVAQPESGFVRNDAVGGGCPIGSWSGNTWTTGTITADCTVEISFAPPPADPGQTTFDASPTSGVEANGSASSTLTLTLRDQNNTVLADRSVFFTIGSGTGGTLSTTSATTNSSGQATVTLRSTDANTITVQARDGDNAGAPVVGTASVTFVPGPLSAAQSTVSASPLSVVADGETESTITVTLRDASDNPIPDQIVTLAQGPGGSTISPASGESDSDGLVTFTVTNTTAQTVVYTASVGGTAITETATVTFQSGPAASLDITTNAAGAASGAAFTTQPIVVIQDAQGNLTASTAQVTMTVSEGGTVVGTGTETAVDGEAGFADVGISGVTGEYTLTFTSGELSEVTQQITLEVGAATKIEITEGDGQSAQVGTKVAIPPAVRVSDSGNNPVSAEVIFAVDSGGGTVDPTTEIATSVGGIATVDSWTLGTTVGGNTLTATVVSDPAISASFTATGTLDSPFTITTAEDLLLIAANPDGDFILNPGDTGTGGSFDLTSLQPWTPIGTPDRPFTGSIKGVDGNEVVFEGLGGEPLFDVIGGGAEISDITIKDNVRVNAEGPAGLFANEIGDESGDPVTLSNIRIDGDSAITGADGQDNIGGLAGTITNATLTDIGVDAEVTGKGDNTGGLAGTINDSSLGDVEVGGEVTGTGDNTGGIGGTITDSDLTDVTVEGAVTGSGENTGGIGGDMTDTNATDVKVNGAVTGSGDNTGGVGGTTTGGTFTNIEIDGEVVGGGNNTGGIGGTTNGTVIRTVVVNGDVEGDGDTGGIGGNMTDTAVEDSTVSGDVTGGGTTGGVGGTVSDSDLTGINVIGEVRGTGDKTGGIGGDLTDTNVIDVTVDGSVTGDGDTGGVGGNMTGTEVEGGTVNGTVTGVGNTGGVGGTTSGGTIKDVEVNGDVAGDGDTGGVGGNMTGTGVEGGTVNGTVTGVGNTGGVGGTTSGGTIKDVEVNGDVAGDGDTGGVGGNMTGTEVEGGTVNGTVTGVGNTGGVGGTTSGGTIKDVEVNGDVEGAGDSGGVGGNMSNTDVEGATVNGDVTGGGNTGGIGGTTNGGAFSDVEVNGEITGDGDTGGIGGNMTSTDVSGGTVNGPVTGGNGETGGIAGDVTDGAITDVDINGEVTDGEGNPVDKPFGAGTPGAGTGLQVTATAGVGGSINPSVRLVTLGDSAEFSLTPDTGFFASQVTGSCGGELVGSLFTTAPITQVCTVEAVFTERTGGGSGTEAEPFIISSPSDLLLLAANPDAFFVLDPDGTGTGGSFDLTSLQPWTPIGTSDRPFTGSITGVGGNEVVFEGLGGQPLFDVIGGGAAIFDITIQGNVRTDATGPAGLLANVIEGAEGNPAVLGNIRIDGDSAITGAAGEDNIGGLAGTITNATLTDIGVDAEVTGNGDNTGGLGGTITGGTLEDITVTGDVTGGGTTGGIGGDMTNTHLTKGTVRGEVAGDGDTGGISGSTSGGRFTDVEVTGPVTGGGNTGGIGGSMTGTDVDGGTVDGPVTGGSGGATGGIAGAIDGGAIAGVTIEGEVTDGEGEVQSPFGSGSAGSGFVVTVDASSDGSVRPLVGVVALNNTLTITGQAEANHFVGEVDGCGIAETNTDQSITSFSYTTGAIGANCTVSVEFKINQHTLSFDSAGGSAVNPITQDFGTPITAPADPTREGFTFAGWEPAIPGTMPAEDRTLVAQWTVNAYTVATSASPTAGGNVSGAGTFNFGTSVTVEATPNSGFSFVNWTEGGTQVSTDASYTFTMPATSRSLVANFTANEYVVTVGANPADGGSVSGAGGYDFGTSVTVEATPSAGYSFVNWTEGGTQVSTDASYTFTMPAASRSLVANFTANEYVVTVGANPADGGSVSGAGGYDFGTSVTVEATPSAGFSFVNWTEGGTEVSTDASYTFSMPAASRSLVANFSQDLYRLTVTNGSGSGNYALDAVVDIRAASAPEGQVFEAWTGDIAFVADPTVPNTTVTMPAQAISLTATYRDRVEDTYALSVVSGSGSGQYLAGTQVTIVAAPAAEGQVFERWTGDVGFVANVNLPSTEVTMPEGAVTVQATYKDAPVETYALTVVGGSGGGTFPAGRAVSIAANLPPEGQVFDRWLGDTAHVENPANPNTTVVMPDQAVTVSASYREPPVETFTLSVASGSGSGDYPAGRAVTIAANAAPEGQVFDRWRGQTDFLANANAPNTEVIMPAESIAVQASYRERPVETFALTVTSGTGDGDYAAGEVITIAAEPAAEGQAFVRWTGQTAQVANVNQPNTTLTMPASDVSVTAVYAAVDEDDPEPRTLTVNDGTGDGRYRPGRVVLIAADVRDGELFDRWIGQTAGIENVNLPNTTLVMPNADVTVTATFKPDPERMHRLRQQARVPSPSLQAMALGTASLQVMASETTVTDERDVRAGLVVRLLAPPAPSGYVFDKWVGQTTHVANIHQADTYVYMPDNEVDVTATYREVVTPQPLTVESGTGSGDYLPGTLVTLVANPAPEGQVFERWEGQTAQVANVNRPQTELRMPGTPVRVRAVYRDKPEETFRLTVRGNDSEQDVPAGETLTITSATPGPDEVFARWIGQVGTVEDIFSAQTTLYMPATDVTLVATFASVYTVTAEAATVGGTVSPASQEVVEQERAEVAVTLLAGYALGDVSGCGSGEWVSGNLWRTDPIVEDCGLVFRFQQIPVPDPDPPRPDPEPPIPDPEPPVPDPEPPVPDPEPPVPDPEPPVIDDGEVFCAIGCEERESDTGERTVVFEFEDAEGVQVRLEAVRPQSPGDPLRHRVVRTLPDGTETVTEAVSWLPGSTVTLERDAQGQPQIVTRAELEDEVVLEVVARADGSAEHRVKTAFGDTVAATAEPGAFTQFTREGVVETHLGFAHDEERFRALVRTQPNGEGRTWFERWDAMTEAWVLASRTIDPISVFEVGHQVVIEAAGEAGLRFEIRTRVTRDLYF